MPEAIPSGTPLVSVVIPTYQRPTFLGRAIESVLKQTYENWELLVIDDNDPASEARRETEALMRRFEEDARIRYLKHERNQGGAAARNTGIEQARGEYVAFLDDDDEWLPEKLTAQLLVFAKVKADTAAVYTGFYRITESSHNPSVQLPKHRGNLFEALLKRNVVGTTSTLLCRRKVLLQVGLFDPALPAKQDVDLYLRLARYFRFDYVAEPLVYFHQHANARVSNDDDRAVIAHKLFYAKYATHLCRYPKIHSYRLKNDGKVLFRAGYLKDATQRFWCAARLTPFDREIYLLSALLGIAFLKAGWSSVIHYVRGTKTLNGTKS
jgi:glycosyltransferase involved in cell wall biosynthesis